MTNYLLDSHIYIWLLTDDPKLPIRIRNTLSDQNSILYVSDVSLWELSIKYLQGKLGFEPKDMVESVSGMGIILLPLRPAHIINLGIIQLAHKDPFDRMICSQAQSEGYVLVTADKMLVGCEQLTVLNAS